jgi:hypothetical protein
MFWSRSVPLHRERLQTFSLGNTLLLKLCGFIADQNAELLSVDEQHVELRIGPAFWWQSWLTRTPRFRLRLDVEDALVPVPVRAPNAPQRAVTSIGVTLDSLGKPTAHAETAAWGVLYRLRSYLMACDVSV